MKAKGCGPLRRQVSKSLYLKSITLDPPGVPCLPACKGLSRQACQVLHLDAFGLRSGPLKGDDKAPPPYQPAIVIRAGISSDGGVLYPSDCLPLRIWVTVPMVAQRQLKAFLKSVRLFMVDPTLVRDGLGRAVRLSDTFIREVHLQIPLRTSPKEERLEVDPTSWKSCKVPRSLPMPKPIHQVHQPYLLQVLCEFSCVGMASTIVRRSYRAISICTGTKMLR